MNNTGFVAGTLVHTDKGLVPIQDIEVGDMVLSRPERGGNDAPTEYKRVSRAFCSGEDEIIRLNCQKNSEYGDPDALRYFEFMTANHSVWDQEINNWVPASEIEIGTLLSSVENKDNLRVVWVDKVWDSYSKNVGLANPIFANEDLEADIMFKFEDTGYKVVYKEFNSDYYINESIVDKLDIKQVLEIHRNFVSKSWAGNKKPIQVPVYNLEVEGFHTYFIGETGIWVHDPNAVN